MNAVIPTNKRVAFGKKLAALAFTMVLLVTLTGCMGGGITDPTQSPPVSTTAAETQDSAALQAQVTFDVSVPATNHDDEKLYLDVLDEVTGLALNPTRYQMTEKDGGGYTLSLPFTLGSVVKYRYYRGGGSPAMEYTPLGRPVRYRMFYVTGQSAVNDLVSAWNDTPYNGITGRISGQVVAAGSGAPVPNMVVTAGGMQTISASNGGFMLEGIAEGIHNLVVYAMDGAIQPYQQGAQVMGSHNTPAIMTVTPMPLVNVTFNVTVPQEFINVPIRLAGNLSLLGNTFADLQGGISVIASRTPLLMPVGERQYAMTVAIPAGTHVVYKYTLGDGFWNAEQTSQGGFRLRELIVPQHDTTVTDTVETWRSDKSEPVTFEVVVPETTPAGDTVSIAFNPSFGWTQPIPMWKVANNRWLYVLAGPFNLVEKLSYRYCRNDQCGSADDIETQGANAAGFDFNTGRLPQTFEDDVTQWAWWQPSTTPTTVLAADARARGSTFLAGVEIQPEYHPSWQSHYLTTYQTLQSTGTNSVVLTPTWTVTNSNPPVIEPVPGYNPLLPEQTETILQARGMNLNAVVYPMARFEQNASDWWRAAPRDFAWWQAWFASYHNYILNFADVAQQTGAAALIMGGDWIAPALPDGRLADGSPSNVPADAADRWRQIIAEVRSHYSGRLMWAVNYNGSAALAPQFVDAVDALYVEFSGGIIANSEASEKDLETSLFSMFDRDLLPLKTATGKALILAAAFPSAQGSATGCLPGEGSACLDWRRLSQPNPDLANITVDLQEQVDIYNALLYTVNQKEWIDGFVSRGFYPPVGLEDKSASINGKPAFHVLWYWYPLITGR